MIKELIIMYGWYGCQRCNNDMRKSSFKCRKITEAMPTCLTALLKVMLNFPPLYMYICNEGTTATSAFRIDQTANVKSELSKTNRDLIILEFMSKPTHIMPIRCDLEWQFDVITKLKHNKRAIGGSGCISMIY